MDAKPDSLGVLNLITIDRIFKRNLNVLKTMQLIWKFVCFAINNNNNNKSFYFDAKLL